MLQNGIVYGIALLIPMVLVRFVGKAEYGTYSQTFMVGRIVYASFLFGIIPSIYHFYPLYGDRQRQRFIVQCVTMLVLHGALAALFTLGAAGFIGERFANPDLPRMLMVYAVYLFFVMASDYFIPLTVAQGNYKLSVVCTVLENIVKLLCISIALFGGAGIEVVMATLSGFALVRFLLYTVLSYGKNLRDREGSLFAFDRAMLMEQLHFSMPLGLTYIVGLAGQHLDKILVSSWLAPEQYAIYAIGAIEIPLASIIQNSVMTVLRTEMPALVRENRLAEACFLWRESARKQALLMLPFFAFILVNAQDLVVVLFTEDYRQSASVLAIYVFMLLLQTANYSIVPLVFKRTRFILAMALMFLAASACFGILFIPLMSYNGPALGMVLANLLINCVYLGYSARLLGTSVATLFPWKGFIVILLLALGCALLPFLLLRGLIHSKLIFLAVSAALFFILYLIGVMRTAVLSDWDRQLVGKWLAKGAGKFRDGVSFFCV